MMSWMSNEAKRQNIPAEGYCGGKIPMRWQLTYRIEDLIHPHTDRVQVNFVVCILRHHFDQSDSVF